MAATTSIGWTEKTWNPVTGCDRISPGCQNCFAARQARRLKGMGQRRYQRDGDPRTSGPGFAVTAHPDALHEPLSWRRPAMVFVNSMSDLFHARIDIDFTARVFAIMASTGRHTYQILTKRPERAQRILSSDGFAELVKTEAAKLNIWPVIDALWDWPLRNVWVGVSVEDQEHTDSRLEHLRATPAALRFLSAEPLLDKVTLGADHGLDWIIVGGESGPSARPMDPAWAEALVDECEATGTPVFVKQMGSHWARTTKHHGRSLAATGDTKGEVMTAWPTHLRVRQMPRAAAR